MPPLITIILPTHNRTAFLAEALAGVEAQDDVAWHLLVSDGSSDLAARNTLREIVDCFAAQHPDRVTWRERRSDFSLPEQLNASLAEVDTEFVALLDDDDVWLPGHLRRAIHWLAADPRRGLAVANADRIDPEGRGLGPLHDPDWLPAADENRRGWTRHLLRSFYGAESGYVARTAAWRDPRLFTAATSDHHLALLILARGWTMRAFPAPSWRYRVHAASLTGADPQRFRRDRDRLRACLALRHGGALTRLEPHYPLLAAWSAIRLLIFR